MTTIDKVKTKKKETDQEVIDESPIEYKAYKTIDEQIEYLKNKKNILVKDEEKEILSERNYVSIINPYKEFFATSHLIKTDYNVKRKIHIYKNQTSILQFKELAELDDNISSYFYNCIGVFERRFKNVLIQEICGLYNSSEEIDKYCIRYIDDIEMFLVNQSPKSLPCFCVNFFKVLSKDRYNDSEYFNENRLALLRKIRNIGIGQEVDVKNPLISHYIKQQYKSPLWIIPNALTLGELNILYSILDGTTQKKVIERITNEKAENIRIKDIATFQSYLENIRRIRNVVNHYEPIIPFFVLNITDKKIELSQFSKTIELVQKLYKPVNKHNLIFPNIPETEYNRKKIRIIKYILGLIK